MGKKKPEDEALPQEEAGYEGPGDEEILEPESPEYEDIHDPDDTDAEEQDETPDPDYVVLKGNCVRHNGREYSENMCIPVTGADAERLIQAGVIADQQTVLKKALAKEVGVSITEG